jgi:hypothetical protein
MERGTDSEAQERAEDELEKRTRPHTSLGYRPPIGRLPSLNNLVGLHS